MKPLTIGGLARRAGVSRSALLNYERLGLIAPARTAAGYRAFGAVAVARVEQIRAYRATGLGLEAIAALLNGDDQASLIERRLRDIHREIAQLREQQDVLLALLRTQAGAGGMPSPTSPTGAAVSDGRAGAGHGAVGPAMTKARWTAMLRAAGLDDAAMARWHALFEHQAPEAHEDFLRSLGLDSAEVARIRSWSGEMGV